MHDRPDPRELVDAVAGFLARDIAPLVTGSMQFQLRVAVNALDLVARQLADASAADETARLSALLGRTGTLDDLTRDLAARIASGAMTLDTPGLADHLWATTLAKLAVDQPTYPSYKLELAVTSSRSADAT